MNPSGENSPPVIRRFPLSTLLLLFSLVAFFCWFFYMRVQSLRYAAIIQSGSAALAKKDTAKAKGLFDSFLRANATDPNAYVVISDVCAKSDQPNLALEYAQHGLNACKNAPKPQLAELYMNLAQAQALVEPAHPQTKAIASARMALSLDPDNLDVLNALGYTLADNDQDLGEAEKRLRQALLLLKPTGDALSDLRRPLVEDSFGWLLYKKGDYAGAALTLNQAIQDMPTGQPGYLAKEYYYHLGAASRKAGQIDEARRALDIALHYDPTFSEAKAEEALLPPPNTPAATPPPSAASPANPSASVPASTPPSSSVPGLKL